MYSLENVYQKIGKLVLIGAAGFTALLILLLSFVFLSQMTTEEVTVNITTRQGKVADGSVYLYEPDLEKRLTVNGAKFSKKDFRNASTVHLKLETEPKGSYTLEIPKKRFKNRSGVYEASLPRERLYGYKVKFYINSTGEPLTGKVYTEGGKIGVANNGSIYISKRNIDKGQPVYLVGNYSGETFNLTWTPENLEEYTQDFYITRNTLNSALWDATDLNETLIESYMFKFWNKKRNGRTIDLDSNMRYDIPRFEPVSDFTYYQPIDYLSRSPKLAEVASFKSRQMARQQYFSHESPAGRRLGDILKDRKIFYIDQGNNLYFLSVAERTSERRLAYEFIKGWMESPGHRSTMVDRDRLYSHAGMGVACTESTCYATGLAARMRKTASTYLEEDYCWFVPAYRKGLGLSYPVNATINVRMTNAISVALVNSRTAYQQCIDTDSYDAVRRTDEKKEISWTELLKPGYGLVFNSEQASNVTVEIDYTS